MGRRKLFELICNLKAVKCKVLYRRKGNTVTNLHLLVGACGFLFSPSLDFAEPFDTHLQSHLLGGSVSLLYCVVEMLKRKPVYCVCLNNLVAWGSGQFQLTFTSRAALHSRQTRGCGGFGFVCCWVWISFISFSSFSFL